MLSYYAVLVFVVALAAAIVSGIDAGMRLRVARRPVTGVVLVLSILLLLSIVTLVLHALPLLVSILAGLLLIALIVQFVTDPTGRRRPLAIIGAVAAVLTILVMWPLVGLMSLA